MKPSFAEQVESYTSNLLPEEDQVELQLGYNTSHEVQIRQQRVARLNDTDYQLVYLTAFNKIVLKLFPEIKNYNLSDQAIAIGYIYNSGFQHTQLEIDKTIKKMNNKTTYCAHWNYLDHLQQFIKYKNL
jgi:hypothetical protein